jgi:hypothetical protein
MYYLLFMPLRDSYLFFFRDLIVLSLHVFFYAVCPNSFCSKDLLDIVFSFDLRCHRTCRTEFCKCIFIRTFAYYISFSFLSYFLLVDFFGMPSVSYVNRSHCVCMRLPIFGSGMDSSSSDVNWLW